MIILKNFATILGNLSPTFWNISTVMQLKFKFNALQAGLKLNTSDKVNIFNLRRNIHRLEKGLSYPTPKASFAEDYILETVVSFKEGIRNDVFDVNTKNWAMSVLNHYFQVVTLEKERPIRAKKIFLDTIKDFEIPQEIPYLASKRPSLNINYDELLQLSIRRRSVRYFSQTPIDFELIKKAYEIAKYAPSACNRQAFQFLFYNDPVTVKRLSKIPGGVAGYELPSLIVVLGRYDGYFDVRDINAPVIDSSLAIMSFLYAAETLGMGTVCINWPNLIDREEKIREVIDINKHEFVIMMIGIGYPLEDGKIPFSGKRPSESVILFNDKLKNR